MKAAPPQPLEISQRSCEPIPVLSAAMLIASRGRAKIAVAGRALSHFCAVFGTDESSSLSRRRSHWPGYHGTRLGEGHIVNATLSGIEPGRVAPAVLGVVGCRVRAAQPCRRVRARDVASHQQFKADGCRSSRACNAQDRRRVRMREIACRRRNVDQAPTLLKRRVPVLVVPDDRGYRARDGHVPESAPNATSSGLSQVASRQPSSS